MVLIQANVLNRFITPEVHNIRFTQNDDAFYILSLAKPTHTLVVDVPLPILAGDTISMLGVGNGTEVEWTQLDSGVAITVPSALADAGKYCWAFKITYSS